MIQNNPPHPALPPDVVALIDDVLTGAQAILGRHFIGMYLEGSLANGDFDEDSDIDFLVISDEPLTDAQFAALYAMHERIAAIDTPWAIQLEGSYLSAQALRRHDPAQMRHPNLERGPGEKLKLKVHDADWAVHRAIVRERGIRLAGPAPETLVDPVTPEDLRAPMYGLLKRWGDELEEDLGSLAQRGGQSYTVLSICRILYTLHHGRIASKKAAARWAQEAFGPRWAPLIERAWDGRHNSGGPASAEDVSDTAALMRFALERAGKPV